jgi:hypothetical protein
MGRDVAYRETVLKRMMNTINMKQGTRITASAMVAVLVIAASCTRETHLPAGTPVTVTARVGQTRAGNFPGLSDDATDAGGKDFYIATLRLLVFRAGGGALLHNYPFDLEEEEELYFELTTNTRYDIAIIANEGSDPALHGQLAALSPASTLATLSTLSFASTAIGTTLPLPMTRLYRDVMAIPDGEYPGDYTPAWVAGKIAGKIAANGGDDDDGDTRAWEVKLTRLATRVELTLVLADQAMADRFEGISVRRVPNKVYLFNPAAGDSTPARYNITGAAGEREATSRDIAKAAGSLDDGTGAWAGKKVWTAPRLVLPACEFEDPGEEDNAILLVACLDDEKIATLGTTDLGFTAPRDAIFTVTGTVNADISLDIAMKGWEGTSLELPLDGPDDSPYIAVYYNGSPTPYQIIDICDEQGKNVGNSAADSYVITRPAWVTSDFKLAMYHRLDECYYWATGQFTWEGELLTPGRSGRQNYEDNEHLPLGKYVILCEQNDSNDKR